MVTPTTTTTTTTTGDATIIDKTTTTTTTIPVTTTIAEETKSKMRSINMLNNNQLLRNKGWPIINSHYLKGRASGGISTSKYILHDGSRRLHSQVSAPQTERVAETTWYLRSGNQLDPKWGFATVSHRSHPSHLQQPPKHVHCRTELHFRRNSKIDPLWCHSKSGHSAHYLFSDSRRPKEEWEMAFGNRYAIPESTSSSTKVQDGRFRGGFEDDRTRRLHVYDRPKRWLLPPQHVRPSYSFHGSSMGRDLLCLQSPPIRISNFSAGVLKSHPLSNLSLKKKTTSHFGIFRRFSWTFEKQFLTHEEGSTEAAGQTRVSHFSRKVELTTGTREGIPGITYQDERSSEVLRSAEKEENGGKGDLTPTRESRASYSSEESGKSSRIMHLPFEGCGTHLTFASKSVSGSQNKTELERLHSVVPSSHSGLIMVEGTNDELGWQNHNPKEIGSGPVYRREQSWMGWNRERFICPRVLDSRSTSSIYQLSRTNGRVPLSFSIPRANSREGNPDSNRQSPPRLI